jgi:hypothetical protein
MSVDDEFGTIWKRAVAVYFKILFQHLPGRNNENCENLNQDRRPAGQESNSGPPEYEAVNHTTVTSRVSVCCCNAFAFVSFMLEAGSDGFVSTAFVSSM